MFAFGGQTPGAGGVSNPSSFSLGGSASGASARRRAKGRRNVRLSRMYRPARAVVVLLAFVRRAVSCLVPSHLRSLSI
eukprot:scaffold93_cov68-Skeletonema_menzelii.AAC.1